MSAIGLHASYAMSGADLRACYAMSGTAICVAVVLCEVRSRCRTTIAHAAIRLRNYGYPPTHLLCDVRY
eukprot:1440494-Rhodomonas_salina.1